MLPPPVIEQARVLSQITARPLVSVIMRLGLLTESQMTSLRKEQARLTTAELLDRTDGSLRFFEFPELKDVFGHATLNLVELLWERACVAHADLDLEQAEGEIQGMARRYISLTEVGKKVLHELPVEGPERELLNRLTRPTRSVEKLLKRTRIGTTVAVKLLLTLRRMGVISIAASGDDSDAHLERELRDRFGRLDRDHFQLLDLHWSALPEEIRAASDRLDKDLREFGKIGGRITNFSEMRGRLLERLTEIQGLADDDVRLGAYRTGVSEGEEREVASVMFLKQGEMALYRKDFAQARLCFRRVLAIDPGSPGSAPRHDRARQALGQLQG